MSHFLFVSRNRDLCWDPSAIAAEKYIHGYMFEGSAISDMQDRKPLCRRDFIGSIRVATSSNSTAKMWSIMSLNMESSDIRFGIRIQTDRRCQAVQVLTWNDHLPSKIDDGTSDAIIIVVSVPMADE